MGFLDKLKDAKDVAVEKATAAGKSVKSGIEKTKDTIEKKHEKSKQAKLPQDGGLKRYEVTYRGGHPKYDVTSKEIKSYPYIIMDVMPDRFSFLPKSSSEKWFDGLEIPYENIISLEIIERIITSMESFLSSGNNNSDLKQKNVLEFKFIEDGSERVVRFEMLTGMTVMGQASVCVQMMDLLRNNHIIEKFKGEKQAGSSTQSGGGDDILEQIKKLSSMKDAGILTEEEFSAKKAELLARM